MALIEEESKDEEPEVRTAAVTVAATAAPASPDNFPDEEEQNNEHAPVATAGSDEDDTDKSGNDGCTRRDILFACIVILAVIGGVTAVAVIFTRDNTEDSVSVQSVNSTSPMQNETSPEEDYEDLFPTEDRPVVLVDNPEEQLNWIRARIGENNFTKGYLDLLPADVASLQGKAKDTTAHPAVRAASWLVHDDPLNDQEQLVRRFALATIYFSTNGDQWTNNTHWLSERPVCTRMGHETGGIDPEGWYGISCCGGYYEKFAQFCQEDPYAIVDINLHENKLEGEITEAFVLLPELRSIRLSWNQMKGTIPGSLFASMSELIFLYLEHNQFTGEVPGDVIGPSLDTFYVHGNGLNGTFPETLCPEENDEQKPLENFGVDCDKVDCNIICCDPRFNCFYGN